MANSGFVVISTAYNNNHRESVLLVPTVFFCPSLIVLLHVAAIFVAVHMKATDSRKKSNLGAFIVSHAYW